jgi:hypothetical protein
MFEVGGQYANRIGNYEVIEIDEPRMTVRYEDGTTAELSMGIQFRIWENILAEEEVKHSRSSKSRKRKSAQSTQFYVRPINSLVAEQLGERGWKEFVVVTELPKLRLSQGDRLLYYSIEGQVFFAVATITGAPKKPTKKDKIPEKHSEDSVLLFPLDIDAQATIGDQAIAFDRFEFESQPKMKNLVKVENSYIPITEDEFELLAELLSEVTEEDEDDEEKEEDEFEE